MGHCFQGPLHPFIPNLKNSFSLQPFTAATDTVRPLTSSLFGPSRATSPHGIINQPEARRLDWPPATFGLTRFPSAICLWCTMPRPSLGPEESSGAKNNSLNRQCSDPKILLSFSVSHPGSLPALAMLSVTAANVLVWLLQILACSRECKGKLVGWCLIGHIIGDLFPRQGENSWQETVRISVVCWGLARRGRMLGMVDSCTTELL